MEWKTVKLGEVCDIRRGASPRPIQEFLSSQGMPWIKISDATATDSKYIDKTKEFIIEEGVSHSVLIEPGTLIVSNSATPGLPKISRITACVHDGWLVIDNFRGILKDFLYYKFIEIRSILGNQANGSVFMNLKTDIVKEFLIHIPDIEKQRKIVSILSSLDDKIENNNCINRNLEAQAQALFKSWFVDFEPWGGTMPEDWKEYQLTEFAEIISGYSYKGAELLPSEDAMATIKNFDRKGYFKLDGYKEIQISGRLKNTQILNLFDVIVAHTDITQQADIIGNPAIILSKGGYRNIIMSMDLCKVQPTHYAISSAFLYCLLKDIRFKSHALGYVNGTTVLHMSKKALPEYRVFLPNDLSKVQELGDRLQNLYKRYSINLEESSRLAALRDTLLPKLMRGEITL